LSNITLFYFLVGFLVVFIFSINYFNHPSYKFVDDDKSLTDDDNDVLLEPALPKYLTDRFEYNFYLAAYVLVTEVIYIMLVLFLPDLVSNGDTEDRTSFIPTQGNIILAALIITGIAPNLPYVRQLLERSKLYLHQKAQIPRKGQNVYRQIKNNMPCYSSNIIGEILKDSRFLADDTDTSNSPRPDLSEEDFKLGRWTIEARWAKLTYLLYFVDKWSRSPPFISYIGNRELQYSSIDKAYENLQRKITEHKAGKLSEVESIRLHTRLDATLHRTYRLLSCLLYLAAKTDTAVDNYLDDLGYASTERKDFPIPWNTVVIMIAAIVFSIVIGSIISVFVSQFGVSAINSNISTRDIISWTGYGVPFIVIPVLAVLFIKRYLSTRSESWPVVTEDARYNSYMDRPWHIYFLVALFAYLVGAVVLYSLSVTAAFINQKELEYIRVLRVVLAWSSVVFLTAGYTAFRLDSAPDRAHKPRKHYLMRCIGACSQGLLTSSLVYFVYIHTAGLPLNIFREETGDYSRLFVMCLIAFFLGLSINLATGLGRLRQRRKHGRRLASRPVILNIDDASLPAETVNISQEGALVKANETLMSSSHIDTSGSAVIIVSNGDGETTRAKIVHVRGDRIHLFFEDAKYWLSLQEKLSIPLPAG
jgi:hypothetical protein